MAFLEPYAGLVIRYSYRRVGSCYRQSNADPVAEVKLTHLGEDGQLFEAADLRRIPGSDLSTVAYGPLPPRFFARVLIEELKKSALTRNGELGKTE